MRSGRFWLDSSGLGSFVAGFGWFRLVSDGFLMVSGGFMFYQGRLNSPGQFTVPKAKLVSLKTIPATKNHVHW